MAPDDEKTFNKAVKDLVRIYLTEREIKDR
jgi:hypothetical protein